MAVPTISQYFQERRSFLAIIVAKTRKWEKLLWLTSATISLYLVLICLLFPKSRSYLVLAGKTIQPGETYKVAVTLFRDNNNKNMYNFPFGPYDNLPATIQVQILRKGAVITSELRECHFGSDELITVTVSVSIKPNGHSGRQNYLEKIACF
jgi:hypothetical protein